MSRYSVLFEQLAAKKQGAFVPFVTLGDPSPELSLQIIDTLIAVAPMPWSWAFPSPIRSPMALPSRMPTVAP